ncbi:hypothetical protein [Pseudomonas japonica]|uniref:Uncharacterized protein n=1 Tax=Pseudomonas japonica TaxID=256466 RepID=A0A239L554_9PSED|nr:hypothetical protein [Pseudomonas japonica]SNT25455.1 hypothetical protein SAMN05444352_13220 [Pseudomonas japonica]
MRFFDFYKAHGSSNLSDFDILTRGYDNSREVEQARKEKALEVALECVKDGTLTSIDSIESPLSKKIKEFHGRDTFEINSHWIEMSQLWFCPCCERDKFGISRVGNKGQVLAKLVVHHDHIADALKAAFNKVFVEFSVSKPTLTGLSLVDRLAEGFATYSPVLVCEDCNNADAKAKRAIADRYGSNLKYHSFSIMQITRFIVPREHSPHDINEEELFSIWLACREDYKSRMKLIYEVAKVAVLTDCWFEGYPADFNPIPTLSNRKFYGGLGWVSPEALSAEVKKQAMPTKPNMKRWRTEPRKKGAQPPESYLSLILSLPGCRGMWESAGEKWVCPVCCRSKYETVEYFDKEVSFITHSPPRQSPKWRGVECVCKSCFRVMTAMMKELRSEFDAVISSAFDCVGPVELKSMIIASPHSQHRIDNKVAIELLDRKRNAFR